MFTFFLSEEYLFLCFKNITKFYGNEKFGLDKFGRRVFSVQRISLRKGSNWRGLQRYFWLEVGRSIKENIEVAVKMIDIKLIDNEVTKYLLEM